MAPIAMDSPFYMPPPNTRRHVEGPSGPGRPSAYDVAMARHRLHGFDDYVPPSIRDFRTSSDSVRDRPHWRAKGAVGPDKDLQSKGWPQRDVVNLRTMRQKLTDAFQDPATAMQAWQNLTPTLVESLLAVPHDIDHALSYLDHPIFDGARVAAARTLAVAIWNGPSDAARRNFALAEAALLWARQRHKEDPAIQRDLEAIYASVGSAEHRAVIAWETAEYDAPNMQARLGSLLHKALRIEEAQRDAQRAQQTQTQNFFLSGVLLAVAHVAIGAVIGVGCVVAWAAGFASCPLLAATFVAIGVFIAATWGIFYGAYVLYQRYWASRSFTAPHKGPGPAYGAADAPHAGSPDSNGALPQAQPDKVAKTDLDLDTLRARQARADGSAIVDDDDDDHGHGSGDSMQGPHAPSAALHFGRGKDRTMKGPSPL